MTDDSTRDDKTESVHEIISETLQSLEQGKDYHAEKTQQYGVAHDLLTTLNEQIPEQQLEPFQEGFAKYRAFIKAQEKIQIRLDVSLGAIAMFGTSTSAVSITELVNFAPLLKQAFHPPVFWDRERSTQYANRLAKLNGELASAYRGISEAFWGLDANHERAAFGLARQCFDHLFEILAPDDDEIRKSPFFKKKQGTKPHVVSRVERVRYAAATRIRDKQQSEFLAAQASEFVDVYGQLQRLHARAPIGHERARGVLQTFLATVEQWIDALEL